LNSVEQRRAQDASEAGGRRIYAALVTFPVTVERFVHVAPTEPVYCGANGRPACIAARLGLGKQRTL
jgi:hypothetical protein